MFAADGCLSRQRARHYTEGMVCLQEPADQYQPKVEISSFEHVRVPAFTKDGRERASMLCVDLVTGWLDRRPD